MVRSIDGLIASYYLQIKRFIRARSRVVGSIVQPIFWLVFFGIGFSRFISTPALPIPYINFLVPGVILMSVFMASFLSGMSIIWDKEFGFMKVVLVSPAPRKSSLLGRILGDATIAIFQGFMIAMASYLVAPNLDFTKLPIVLGIAFLISVSISSLGIIIASRIRSFEGFGLIMNLISMPLMFASGVFYPVTAMPDWMKAIAYVSPLTYGVDLVRSIMLGRSIMGSIADPMVDLAMLIVLMIILVTLALIMFEKATLE